MKKFILRGIIIACLALGAMLGSAQEKGYWRAASSNADSITGDIDLSATKVSINYTGFVIAQIRQLQPAEVSAIFAAEGAGGTGNLYRLNIPANRRFLHHNSICGSDDTQWMVTSVAGRTLHVAFFSGSDTPVFTLEAINNSSSLCGAFTYVR
jgi:hypothetical protein